MKSPDVTHAELHQKFSDAMKSEDPNAVTKAFADFAGNIREDIMQEFKTYQRTQDADILQRRGIRQLTDKEKEFYKSMTDCAKSSLSGTAKAFTIPDGSSAIPSTIIDAVLEDIKTEFPLLSAINIQNTATITTMIVNKTGIQFAVWGALNTSITEELSGAIDEIDVGTNKLTAFMIVSKDMLDVGPEWMDAYVRAVLVEANGAGLSKAIVMGTGNNEPIGMIKDVSDGVAVTAGVYPDKATISITDLSPTTVGEIASTLATGPNNRARVVDKILMVVNPVDYFTKVMPATTLLTPQGTYANNVLPYPTDIVQDINVPEGMAIFGLASRYFMGVGLGGSGGRIEFTDELKFLEDQRVYKTKLYGNGRPLDNNAFVVADISELEPQIMRVSVVPMPEEPEE